MPSPIITKDPPAMAFAFPNTCQIPGPTGPIPVPMPSLAQTSMATPSTCSTRVKVGGSVVLHEQSEVSLSSGDEAGTAGGVTSGVNMNKVAGKQGSSVVSVEGKKVAILMNATGHNGSNANMPQGSYLVPGQFQVLAGE